MPVAPKGNKTPAEPDDDRKDDDKGSESGKGDGRGFGALASPAHRNADARRD